MSIPYKKIVVTLDGSPFAAQALPHARQLAAALDAELILLEVVPEVEVAGDLADTIGTLIHIDHVADRDLSKAERAQRHLVEKNERALRDLAKTIRSENIKTDLVVDVGKPAEQIVAYTKHHEVDLLVMSTHGRTGMEHLVYGSVAEKVLHEANCPILLVKSFPG